MACYMGCQTKRNKILWGMFAVLVLAAAIFISVGLSRLPVCRRSLPSSCQTNANLSKTRNAQISPDCAQKFANCFRPWLVLAGIGAVALACSLVTTCVMCCCNKPPKHAQHYHTHSVQMLGQPVHPNPYASYEQLQQQQQQHPNAAGTPYAANHTQPHSHTAAAAAGPYQQQYQQQGTPYAAAAAAPASQYANAYPPQGYQQQQQQQQYGAPVGYPTQTHSSVPVHQV